MENNLVSQIAKYLDKKENEVEELIVTMDFRDLAKLSYALRNNDREQVLRILHGYGL